jgi:hypothetical protein
MAEISYCTREQVQDTLQLADSTRLNARIDSAIRQMSRDIEGLCHRFFYPWTGTRTFDQPDGLSLWLYQNELAGAPTLITSGSTTMAVADYILQPVAGPPYTWIDVNQGGTNFWTSNQTTQRAVSITGTFGYPTSTATATTLVGNINSSTFVLTIADSSQVGVGQLCLAESERFVVLEKAPIVTGATLNGGLTANKAEIAITVSDGTLIKAGERVRVDGEWMRVNDIAGNVLYVTRAVNATVLAAHLSGAAVYAPRLLTVDRGQLGTAAAAHLTGVTISNILPPSFVTECAIAGAEVAVSQGASGYARPVGAGSGTGGNSRDAVGEGLADLMERLYQRYGRKGRSRVVGT